MIVRYEWPGFALRHNTVDGLTVTTYDDTPRSSGCTPIADDLFHAMRLSMTDKEHRLHHELAHHIVARATGETLGSPIIFRDARGITQPQREAQLEEWKATALQYHSRQRLDLHHYDTGALMDLQDAGADVNAVSALLEWLFQAARQTGQEIRIGLS